MRSGELPATFCLQLSPTQRPCHVEPLLPTQTPLFPSVVYPYCLVSREREWTNKVIRNAKSRKATLKHGYPSSTSTSPIPLLPWVDQLTCRLCQPIEIDRSCPITLVMGNCYLYIYVQMQLGGTETEESEWLAGRQKRKKPLGCYCYPRLSQHTGAPCKICWGISLEQERPRSLCHNSRGLFYRPLQLTHRHFTFDAVVDNSVAILHVVVSTLLAKSYMCKSLQLLRSSYLLRNMYLRWDEPVSVGVGYILSPSKPPAYFLARAFLTQSIVR